MPRLFILPLVLLILALGAAACDGGGGEAGSPTPRHSATPRPSPTATASTTATAAASATPPGSPTSTPPVKPTPTSTGTRIQPPEDLAKFLDKYKDKQITSQNCELNAVLGEANCGDNGRYALDPAPPGALATCDVRLVDGKPIAVVCSSHEPLTVTYYEIPS